MKLAPRDIRRGDKFVHEGITHWTALSDARREGVDIEVAVVYSDGGAGTRVFAPDVLVTVDREVIS